MTLLYLYGVVREAGRLPATLEDRLELVSHHGLSALVEPVTDEEFSPRALHDKLRSLEWVTAQASKHQAVLGQMMRERAVVPARLCTMFSGPLALRMQLDAQPLRLHALLDAIEGRHEWSIKVFCDWSVLEQELAESQGTGAPASPSDAPGRAFLREKQRRMELARLVYAAIDDCVDDVIEQVEELAFDVRQRSLLSGNTTGRPDAMMLNLAALLDHGSEQALSQTLDELAERHGEGFSIELSGPWPAYSFCEALEVDEPAANDEGGVHVEH